MAVALLNIITLYLLYFLFARNNILTRTIMFKSSEVRTYTMLIRDKTMEDKKVLITP